MKLLTLFGVVLLITSGTWAYSRDCAKGPEYWCRDAATAKDCGAVHHCEQTVWRAKQNDKPSMTVSETAEMLCNVLVQASTKLLAEGSVNVNSIKPYLRRDCTKLPDHKNLIQQCEIAVDLYLSDILRHIESGTDSTKICPIIQRHDTSSAAIPKPKSGGLTSNATCVLCEFFLHVVESLATANASEKELVLVFEKVCAEMPTVLRDECKSFVDANGADIIALLVREVDPAKVCELIKVCPKPKDVAFLTKPNEQTCGLCDYVSTYLKAGQPIENVCSHFSTDNGIRQKCEILAHLYKPNMCSQLPLCFEGAKIQPMEQPIDTTVNSVQCSLCKYVVQYVDTVIENNRTEAAIEAALEKVCTILPHALNSSCVQFVETFGPTLVPLIEKYGTPELVCDAIKLCNNGTEQLTLPKPVQSIQPAEVPINSIECTLCEFVVNYVNRALGANRSAAAVEALLDKACKILPASLQPNCTSFVGKYGPIIALLLAKNETPAQVCDFIKVCNNGTQEVAPRNAHVALEIEEATVNSVQCSLCKYIVGYVDTVIGNNRTEAAIEAALEKVCTILPHALNSSCVQFVETFGPNLLQLLEKYGTPDLVCDAIKLCNNGTEQLPLPKPVQSIQPAEVPINSIECTLCEFVVNYVNKALGANRSAAAVEALLDKACKILPASVQPNCTSFVGKYGPIIALLLAKNETPAQVCDFIKVCNNGTQEVAPRNAHATFKVEEPTVNSVQCSLCKYIVGYVDAAIENNRTEAAIEAALDKVCTILPHALNSSCVQFVETFGPNLLQLLEKYGTPDLVCDAIKLCNNGTEEIRPVESAKPIRASVECSLCTYVVAYVDAVIQTNKSEAAIDSALEKVCTILPHALNHSCVQFVDIYGPVLVEYIAEYATPNEVCAALKVCHNGTEQRKRPNVIKVDEIKRASVNSVECSLCKFIVQYVDNAVQNNKSEAAIEAALEKVCTILPHALNSSCVQFVENYGPILVQLIEKYGTPDLVCDAIKFCNNGTVEPTFTKPVQSIQPAEVPITSIECTLCEFVVNYVNRALGANRSAAAVEALLDKACKILPASLQPNCTSFVGKYGPIIALLLAKNETPAQVCDFIKVCKNGTQEVAPRNAHVALEIEEPTVNSVQCSLCKYVVQYVDTAIENNRTEAAIEAALEKVCTILPHALNSSCVQFVETFGPNLLQLLEKYGTPDLVCDAIKLCNNGTEEIKPVEPIKPLVATVECSLCKYVVGYVDTVIQNNKSEAAIEAALEKVCTILPHALNSSCVQFVETFGPNLVQLLEKYGTPALVCDALKLCHNGTNVAETIPHKTVESKKSVNDDLECTLCKYVISFINVLVESNATEEEVEKGLKAVCSLLPAAYHTKCTNFVTVYGPILPELIAELDDPNVICELLKACKKSYDKFIHIPSVKTKVKSLPCNLCQYVVNYLDVIVESNSTETKFEEALDEACKILPETKIQSECKILVNLYGADLIKLVVEFGDPKTVCQELGICDK